LIAFSSARSNTWDDHEEPAYEKTTLFVCMHVDAHSHLHGSIA
jgi:hypothetical protein